MGNTLFNYNVQYPNFYKQSYICEKIMRINLYTDINDLIAAQKYANDLKQQSC